MTGQEVSGTTTICFDTERKWSAAGGVAYERHTKERRGPKPDDSLLVLAVRNAVDP
jgi:hypothetical protein